MLDMSMSKSSLLISLNIKKGETFFSRIMHGRVKGAHYKRANNPTFSPIQGRVGIKKPTQKNPKNPPNKTH
jgi:hypothetical protein